jgi:hypothetical protein
LTAARPSLKIKDLVPFSGTVLDVVPGHGYSKTRLFQDNERPRQRD